MFNFRSFPRVVCKECGGLMDSYAPRHNNDVAIHFWCGTKLKGDDDGVLRLQTADSTARRVLQDGPVATTPSMSCALST